MPGNLSSEHELGLPGTSPLSGFANPPHAGTAATPAAAYSRGIRERAEYACAMRESPQVTVRDPRQPAGRVRYPDDGGSAECLGDDARTLSRRRRIVFGVLLLGCAAGLVGAHGFDSLRIGASPADLPLGLVVVTSRVVPVQQEDDAQPRSGIEVTLVNTGGATLRVLSAGIGGLGLSLSADRALEPGAQLTAVLTDPSPCRSITEGVPSSGATLDVDVVDNDGRRRLALPLLPTLLREYDSAVRAVCGMPTLPEALWIAVGAGPGEAGRDLAVPVVLQNRTVKPVRLISVSSTLIGTSAALRTRTGADVLMPLTLPGRSLGQGKHHASTLDVESSPYVLAVTAERGACADRRARGGETVSVGLRYAYDSYLQEAAESFFALDLASLVSRACAHSGPQPR